MADRSDILSATLRVPDHVVFRGFEAETLMLNLETGHYHGLNQTGGRLLELLQETDGRVEEAVQLLADEYDVDADDIADDMAAFCTALAERGLVEVAGHEPDPDA